MSSVFRVLGVLALFWSGFTYASQTTNCDYLRGSVEPIESGVFSKCTDLAAQAVPLFNNAGFGNDFSGCSEANSTSKAIGLNECREFASNNGLSPAGCKLLINFKVDNSMCVFRSIYYFEAQSSSEIQISLAPDLHSSLQVEARKASMTLREYILTKLRN